MNLLSPQIYGLIVLATSVLPASAASVPVPVPELTGFWQILCEGDCAGINRDATIATGDLIPFPSPPPSALAFFQSDSITTSYSQSGTCPDWPTDISPNCTAQWQGTATGTVHLVAFLDPATESNPISANGQITSADFSGTVDCDSQEFCGFGNTVDLSFTAQWSNGWQSTGTANWESATDGFGPIDTIGGITMATVNTTPEPSTIILLGSGALALISSRNRRKGVQP
jgi:hypothetical protein